MQTGISFRPAKLEEIVDLRHRVLRAGLPRESAIFPGDELPTSRHFGLFPDSGQAAGCATFHLNAWDGQTAWQLRGMATADSLRGQGWGRILLERSEARLLAEPEPVSLLWCNGRAPAMGFYQRMGWVVASEIFDIPTAGPHVRMVRRIG